MHKVLKGRCHYFDQGVQRQPDLPKKRVNFEIRKWGLIIEENVKILEDPCMHASLHRIIICSVSALPTSNLELKNTYLKNTIKYIHKVFFSSRS